MFNLQFRKKIKDSFRGVKKDLNLLDKRLKKVQDQTAFTLNTVDSRLKITRSSVQKKENIIANRMKKLSNAVGNDITKIKKNAVSKKFLKAKLQNYDKKYDQRKEVQKNNTRIKKVEAFVSKMEDKLPEYLTKKDIQKIENRVIDIEASHISRDDIEHFSETTDTLKDRMVELNADFKSFQKDLKIVKKGKLPEVMENYVGIKEHHRDFNQVKRAINKMNDELDDVNDFISETYSLKKKFVNREEIETILKEILLMVEILKENNTEGKGFKALTNLKDKINNFINN